MGLGGSKSCWSFCLSEATMGIILRLLTLPVWAVLLIRAAWLEMRQEAEIAKREDGE